MNTFWYSLAWYLFFRNANFFAQCACLEQGGKAVSANWAVGKMLPMQGQGRAVAPGKAWLRVE